MCRVAARCDIGPIFLFGLPDDLEDLVRHLQSHGLSQPLAEWIVASPVAVGGHRS